MNIDQVKEYVTTQLKSYRVKTILDNFDDNEWLRMYKQISPTKPYETERRLIDWARHELDFFRYVLYKERHYEELLIDHACIDCLQLRGHNFKREEVLCQTPTKLTKKKS
jgi:hypothetical protein